MNPATEFQSLVAAFTDEIAGLAKREALRQVSEAFGVHTPKRQVTPLPSRGGKRSTTQLAEIKGRALEYISARPGLRMEQINAGLGTPTKELARPIRQLVAEGAIRTEGERRGTRYYAEGTPSERGRRSRRKVAA